MGLGFWVLLKALQTSLSTCLRYGSPYVGKAFKRADGFGCGVLGSSFWLGFQGLGRKALTF